MDVTILRSLGRRGLGTGVHASPPGVQWRDPRFGGRRKRLEVKGNSWDYPGEGATAFPPIRDETDEGGVLG